MSNAPASAAAAAARAPLPAPRDPKLRQMADALRALAMDAVEKAKSGHPGMPMGMADIATVLFTRYLRFDPQAPDWPDRDRFVLSNGHGSMLLYGLLHLLGYPDMTMAEIERFRQLGSRTAGHPERGHASGIEVTTGPLGQGLGNSVGMALAERLLAAQFGDSVVDHHTYVFCGDGCLMEGISHEALSLAGHLRLSKLIVFYDDNAISIDGPTELAVSDDQVLRFRAHGWAAERIDGHDTDAIAAAIERAHQSDRPSLIACRTIIAFGAPTKAGTAAAHGTRTRRRRDQGRPRAARLELAALRHSRGDPRRVAHGRRPRRLGSPGLGGASASAPGRAARRISAPTAPRAARRPRRCGRRRSAPISERPTPGSPPARPRGQCSTASLASCPSWSAARPI